MIDSNEAKRIDGINPTMQEMGLGAEIAYESNYGVYALVCDITADATAEKSITVPFACEVVDVVVMCTSASAGGTMTLKKGATAITDAMICAVDKVIVRAGTIDDAQSTLAAGGTLTVDAGQAGDRGRVTVLVRRL